MLSLQDFKTIQLQLAIFTPGLRFEHLRILTHLLTRWNQDFPSVVMATDFPQTVAPEIPRIIVQSLDTRWKLQVAPARVDFFAVSLDPSLDLDLAAGKNLACRVFEDYLGVTRGKAGRLACVVTKLARTASPLEAMAKHFFTEQWRTPDGPFQTSAYIEIVTARHTYLNLSDSTEINTFIKFKTSTLNLSSSLPADKPNSLLIEHDTSTPSEDGYSGQFGSTSRAEFFEKVTELVSVDLQPYFSG